LALTKFSANYNVF